MSDREILDEVINSPQYSDTLKINAVKIIEEYEKIQTQKTFPKEKNHVRLQR